jgi:hypothetical protein
MTQMSVYQVSLHNGKVLGKHLSKDGAVNSASWHAKQFKTRVNVYPILESGGTGVRIVSAYPSGLLYEADIADLPHNEYLARHAFMLEG